MANEKSEAWHLTQTEAEYSLTELEFLLWRLRYSLDRWHEDCQNFVGDDDVTADEVALMHCIRMHDNPKKINDISRLMNRDDTANIQYSLKKLLKLGIVKKEIVKKTNLFSMTKKGIEVTDRYTEMRQNIIIKLFKDLWSKEEHVALCQLLIDSKNMYDEASRTINIRYKRS